MMSQKIEVSPDVLQAVLQNFNDGRYEYSVQTGGSAVKAGLQKSAGETKNETDHLFSVLGDTKEAFNMLLNGSHDFFSGVLEAFTQTDENSSNAIQSSLT